MREELREMRQTLERLEADGVQRDHARAEWEKLRRSDLKAIMRSNEQTKYVMLTWVGFRIDDAYLYTADGFPGRRCQR